VADDPLPGVLKLLEALLKLFPGKSKRAELVFRYEPRDFPPCHTRIVRTGRGFPWNKRVAGHTNHNGHVEFRPVEATGSPAKKRKK
jgi:hypothetical protein